VSIPKEHKVGQLEAPSIFRLEFREMPERHVVLMDVEPLESDVFFGALKARVEESEAKSAFVFVHGFNVTFEDAARRTAQIAYDLKFDGAPIFYSWPSQGGLFKYTIDETNVMWTVPHLREFLTDVAERTGARRIHLVAHSMGNRALTSALRDLSFLPEDRRPRFNEVVLTAPDIDAEVFRKDIAPYIVQTADRVTLYASSNDTALAYSKTVHGYPRAGDSGRGLLVVPDMETVDVSEVDTSLLGHNYYGSNETVLADLIEVLHKSLPAQQRRWLRPVQAGTLKYWVFQR
jgi:esterase/lipase superfamily enzyme